MGRSTNEGQLSPQRKEERVPQFRKTSVLEP